MTSYLLLRQEGKRLPISFRLTPGEFLVGRSPDCQIILAGDTVSRRHAKLLISDNGVEVVDLNSRNGTFVEDCRVRTSLVPVGHSIRFGSEAFILQAVSRNAENETTGSRQRSAEDTGIGRARLTPAQRRVYNKLVQGLSEKQVAKQLKVSPHTVHVHTRAIYECFGVHSRAELLSRHIRSITDRVAHSD